MKMTVAECLVSHNALIQFGKEKYPFQPTMVVAKNKALLSEVSKEYELRRQAIIKKYGTADKDGNVQVVPEKMEVFTKSISDMQAEEIDLDLKTVSLVELKGAKRHDPEVEPNIIEPLVWMFTMEGQKPARRKK
jgi:hypothetical protein